jgi:type III restriction enzyme
VAQPEGQVTAQNPIINDPFEEPSRHWYFGAGEPVVVDGRRPSGYLPPLTRGGVLQVTDEVIPLEMVDDIRSRVRRWRDSGYAGATAVTHDLFDSWFDREREPGTRPFFAQREAIESIVWLTEAPADLKVGISVPRFEAYERWAIKLATGAGKTLVMGMVIAWSGLNKVVNRQDPRFAEAFLVVCPNLTVKRRLSGIEGLLPSGAQSVYRTFQLIPPSYAGAFGQVRVQVSNWHVFTEEKDPKHSVLRRGPESDAAFCQRVLRPLGSKRRLMVLNDEAHHAWRAPLAARLTAEERKEAEQATVWIRGLHHVHRDREILRAIDFSATPMYPGVIKEKAWRPFEWIVADFALVDAIEAGLVKIPRVPTDDNAGRAVPKYRNLWEHIKKILPSRSADVDKAHPLTDYLMEVDGPLKQLASEWEQALERWQSAGRRVPPVIIVVCSDIRMAQMLERHIAAKGEAAPGLTNRRGRTVTVRIDSALLEQAELREESETASDAAERIREVVATVGKQGQPGEQVRCIISVAMLSEGWDARNVTQILGVRAFQSQLLCEQVIGRGLRRTDYSDLSQPEYVDVYGVPFQLLPFAKASPGTIIEAPRTTQVRSMPDRAALRIEFPRIVQIVPDIGDTLNVDMDAITPVVISPMYDPTSTWLELQVGAPRHGLGGETQDRQLAYERFRLQRLLFRLAAELLQPYDKPWLFPDAVRLVRSVIEGKVQYEGDVDSRELCNMRYVVQLKERIDAAIRPGEHGDGSLLPVLDEYEPIGSTDQIAFSTSKHCEPTTKSHISHAVCDSGLELGITRALERNAHVVAYAKNDRLFLEIPYRFFGKTFRYRPDYIVRLASGLMLVLEGKGRADEKDAAKFTAAKRWVAATSMWGRLGQWTYDVCWREVDADDIIARATAGTQDDRNRASG